MTLLHSVLYRLLPGFEWIHPHGPERIKVILYLAFAMLAGATLRYFGGRGKNAGALLALPALASLFLITGAGTPVPPGRTEELSAEVWGAAGTLRQRPLGIARSRWLRWWPSSPPTSAWWPTPSPGRGEIEKCR